MRRPSLSKAIAETTPEQAPKNLEQGASISSAIKPKLETGHARPLAASPKRPKPLTLLEMILEIAET